MEKPKNPFEQGTIIWSIMEGDWEDLTPAQIAEVLDCSVSAVSRALVRIKQVTGYAVPHVKSRRGRPVSE